MGRRIPPEPLGGGKKALQRFLNAAMPGLYAGYRAMRQTMTMKHVQKEIPDFLSALFYLYIGI